MSKYLVELSFASEGHTVPPLLIEAGKWIAGVEHGDLGWFDAISLQAIPQEWSEKYADRLQRDAFSFLDLPDGSLLALLKTGAKAPPAVILLGSEGDSGTIANSLEEFLLLWAKGETGIDELDDEECEKGRKSLGNWLKKKNITPPETNEFDFNVWLDTGDGYANTSRQTDKAPCVMERAPAPGMDALGPKVKQLASLIGLRADDPAIVEYVTNVLGKKSPASTTGQNRDQYVEAPKHGIEMVFTHEVLNADYPPIAKTATSFVPYLAHAWVREKVGEPVMNVPWKVKTEADVVKVLGAPTGRVAPYSGDEETIPFWKRKLDTSAHVELRMQLRNSLEVTISVVTARELCECDSVIGGLFTGWAANHGLLDESGFAAHSQLLEAVKIRQAKGSELVKTALPRGLWDVHLKDAPGLHDTAYRWFHNIDKLWIVADMIAVFGKRTGPYGHNEPVLDDDSWDAVDKASDTFNKRFSAWIKK